MRVSYLLRELCFATQSYTLDLAQSEFSEHTRTHTIFCTRDCTLSPLSLSLSLCRTKNIRRTYANSSPRTMNGRDWIRRVLSLLTLSTTFASSEWIPMPDGREYHVSCIHHHDTAFHVTRLSDERTHLKYANGTENTFTKCPFPSRPRGETSSDLQYYSDWSVYAESVHTDGLFGSFESTWTVPNPPKARGPADQSSVYFFNGLEDGGGTHGNASLILQPVLQYGKSGCVLNPFKWNQWHFGAYLVDGNGRAHCGSMMKVKTGESLLGSMTQDPSSERWTVSATRIDTNETSTYSASLGSIQIDSAYVVMEGMVIYTCDAYPPDDRITFTSNRATSKAGTSIPFRWIPMLRHQECNQNVHIDTDQNTVTLLYTNKQ